MAQAPKAALAPHAGRTPAQVAAGKKFAAAGRKAQASARARGKKPSAAQKQAALKWAAAGRAAQAAKRQGKVAPKKAAAAGPGPVSAPLLPGWSLGCNDVLPSCAATAVANHLLAATGVMMAEKEVAWLHERAGGDDGATIESVLELLAWDASVIRQRPVRLRSFTRTDEEVIVAGLVVGVSLPHARHAVLSHPQGMVSWGRVLPWAGEPYEAWALEWLA
jgi:hypothetical protein